MAGWMPDEDAALLAAMRVPGWSWADVAKAVKRTQGACQQRYQRYLRPSAGRTVAGADGDADAELTEGIALGSRAPWQPKEDAALLAALRVPGWSRADVAKATGRTEGACETRYRRHLRPQLRAAAAEDGADGDADAELTEGIALPSLAHWMPDEDAALLAALRVVGWSWADVAEAVNRSMGACRQRYNRHLRPQLLAAAAEDGADGDADAELTQ